MPANRLAKFTTHTAAKVIDSAPPDNHGEKRGVVRECQAQ